MHEIYDHGIWHGITLLLLSEIRLKIYYRKSTQSTKSFKSLFPIFKSLIVCKDSKMKIKAP